LDRVLDVVGCRDASVELVFIRPSARHFTVPQPLPSCYSAPDRIAEYCDERARVCLGASAIISSELHVRSSPIFMHVTYGPGSILIWRRSDMLCTSGFMDNVMFVHKPRLLDVAAQLKRSAHTVLGLAINCAQ